MNIFTRLNARDGIESRGCEQKGSLFRRRIKPIILLTATFTIAVVIASCSKTTFIYNQLDSLIPWYLNRLVKLDHDQEIVLHSLLQPVLDWHRNEELPIYREILKRLESHLDGEIQEVHLKQLEEQAELAWVRLERRSLDGLISIGSSLTDFQLNEFFDSLKKQQVEYEEKYFIRDNTEFAEDAAEELLDFLKKYMGSLTRSQVDKVKVASGKLKRSDKIWLSERAIWLERVQGIMTRESGWKDKIRNLILARESNMSQSYHRVYDWNASVVRAVIVDLVNNASEKQKQKLKSKIAKWISDISSLLD